MSKPRFAVLLAAAVMLVSSGCGSSSTGKVPTTTSEPTQNGIPDFTGKSALSAYQYAKDNQLVYQVDPGPGFCPRGQNYGCPKLWAEPPAKGTLVFEQDPPPGTTMQPNDSLLITLVYRKSCQDTECD